MAGTQLAIFKNGAMPAHIQEINEAHKNIVPKSSTNSVTFEGKTWAITIDGKKTKLMKTGDDGEETPVQVFNCVLLGYNPYRGRMYYEGAYNPKKPRAPDCWSDDSVKPNADVPKPQAKTCAECRMSKKGSSITADNRQTVACSQFQRLCVVPLARLGKFPPLRMNIKITSIWDKDGEAKHPNWYAFDQYMQVLTQNHIHNTSVLPTKIKFDPEASFPKLLFSTGKDFFDAETAKLTNEMAMSDEVKAILAETFHPTAATGTAELPDDEEEADGPAAPVAAQVGPKGKAATKAPVDDEDEEPAKPAKPAAKAPVTLDEDGEEVVLTAEQQARAKRAKVAEETAKAAAEAAAKAAQKAKTKPAVVDEDDEEAELERKLAEKKAAKAAAAKAAAAAEDDDPPAKPKVTAPAKGGAKAQPAAAPVSAPANVAALMEDWDA